MKYLATDLGNVIFKVDFKCFKYALSKSINISLDEAEYFLIRTQKLHDMGLTNISDELKNIFKIKSELIINDLITEWNKTLTLDPAMKLFLYDLSHPTANQEDVKIALLSNIGIEHAEVVRVYLNTISNNFISFFSCEVGARKPSYLYYKTFLDMYPEFKECCYIDDRAENITVGQKFKFKSILFDLESLSIDNAISNKITEIKNIILK